MPKCSSCKYMKVKFAPFIKARVVTCTKNGNCEEIISPSVRKKAVEGGNDLSQNEECSQKK